MFKELKEGQTHYYNDGCGCTEHNFPEILVRTVVGDKVEIDEEKVKALQEYAENIWKEAVIHGAKVQYDAIKNKYICRNCGGELKNILNEKNIFDSFLNVCTNCGYQDEDNAIFTHA